MNRRIRSALIGVLVVVLAVAVLLAIMDILAKTAPQNVTAKNPITSGSGAKSAPLNSNESSLKVTTPAVPPIEIRSTGNLSQVIPYLNINPQGGQLPHLPLFKVSGVDKSALLRTSVTSQYNGSMWKFDDTSTLKTYTGETLSNSVKNYRGKSLTSISVSPLSNFNADMVPLPVTQYVNKLNASFPVLINPASQTFISEKGIPKDYYFESLNYSFDPGVLEAAKIGDVGNYLKLPDNITPRTQQLAQSITQGIESPYLKAKAIENYLESNEVYDYNYTPAPEGREPNDWFLFDEHAGVCSNFNSAFVVLAREAGIPARLVSGYALSPQSGVQTVYADQAHAWGEINLAGVGWIPFDATGQPGEATQSVLKATETEITTVDAVVSKDKAFRVSGTVMSNNAPAASMLVEIFLNSSKSIVGGTKIGQGVTGLDGSFNIDVTLSPSTAVGNYQLLAHALDSNVYSGSWSDPIIKVTSTSKLTLNPASDIVVNQVANVQGSLKETGGSPMAGKNVEIWVNGQMQSRIQTKDDGSFIWPTSFAKAGAYTIKTVFNATDFYAASDNEITYNVFLPTTISLQVEQQTTTEKAVDIRGKITDIAGNPVNNRKIQLFLNNQDSKQQTYSDINGNFIFNSKFAKTGIFQIEARFNREPYYWQSSAQAVLQVNSAGNILSVWIVPAMGILGLLILALVYLLYRKYRKKKPLSLKPLPESPAPSPEKEGIKEKEVSRRSLKITFPGIVSPLPNVWGVNDQIEVGFQFNDENGSPLAGKNLQILLGAPIADVTTDAQGSAKLVLVFSEKGSFDIEAKHSDVDSDQISSALNTIRMVDYREEIVELYNAFKDGLKQQGIEIKDHTTPREIEAKVLIAKPGISPQVLDRFISVFEEADYSLHPVSRSNYAQAYLAKDELEEDEISDAETE